MGSKTTLAMVWRKERRSSSYRKQWPVLSFSHSHAHWHKAPN